jgi:hypothetical protein
MRKLVTFACIFVVGGALCVRALSADSATGSVPATSYAAGSRTVSVAIGDLNGDGKRDLVTESSLTSIVSVLLNVGSGGPSK